ncbi:MAG TPA: alginate export family protein [Verrucomicrobiales bacterium]|nr:alginate export family protein [Verrucomicrobiales bacterium]
MEASTMPKQGRSVPLRRIAIPKLWVTFAGTAAVAWQCVTTGVAGEAQIEPNGSPAPVAPERTIGDYLKPVVDIRGRYEYVDEDGLDDAWAATLRARLGLMLENFGGFSALAELEGTVPADRHSYRAASAHGPASKAIIADPESFELNQVWAAYSAFDTAAKGGRQRIILDNHRFVGNVGWRQNEQTFDAFTLSNSSIEDLTLYYGYIHRTNRIFGSQDRAAAAQSDFLGDTSLVNIRYTKWKGATLTIYGYWMDLENDAGASESNRTLGLSLQGALSLDEAWKLPWHLEYACQTDAFDSPLDYSAHYLHAVFGVDYKSAAFGAGFEVLSSDGDNGAFRTPLATLHKFNGFADQFLTTPDEGLQDLYLYAAIPLPWQMQLRPAVHWFGDDDGSFDYGREIDVELTKKVDDHLSFLAKYAYYDADEHKTDKHLFSIEFDCKF